MTLLNRFEGNSKYFHHRLITQDSNTLFLHLQKCSSRQCPSTRWWFPPFGFWRRNHNRQLERQKNYNWTVRYIRIKTIEGSYQIEAQRGSWRKRSTCFRKRGRSYCLSGISWSNQLLIWIAAPSHLLTRLCFSLNSSSFQNSNYTYLVTVLETMMRS